MAGAQCAKLCAAEVTQLVAKQPELTEGARGAAYDSCFARCAANSPADAVEGAKGEGRKRELVKGGGPKGVTVFARANRKVAAGGWAGAAVAPKSGAGASTQSEVAATGALDGQQPQHAE